MTNRRFIELVAEMRKVQKRWADGDSHTVLAEVRRLERIIDEELERIGGTERQGCLFDVGRRGRNLSRLDAMIATQREEEMRRVVKENSR